MDVLEESLVVKFIYVVNMFEFYLFFELIII